MTTKKQQTKNTPALIAYFVPDREGAPWVRIGAAWEQRDGKGLNVQIDAIPVGFNGRIVLREPKQEEAGA